MGPGNNMNQANYLVLKCMVLAFLLPVLNVVHDAQDWLNIVIVISLVADIGQWCWRLKRGKDKADLR